MHYSTLNGIANFGMPEGPGGESCDPIIQKKAKKYADLVQEDTSSMVAQRNLSDQLHAKLVCVHTCIERQKEKLNQIHGMLKDLETLGHFSENSRVGKYKERLEILEERRDSHHHEARQLQDEFSERLEGFHKGFPRKRKRPSSDSPDNEPYADECISATRQNDSLYKSKPKDGLSELLGNENTPKLVKSEFPTPPTSVDYSSTATDSVDEFETTARPLAQSRGSKVDDATASTVNRSSALTTFSRTDMTVSSEYGCSRDVNQSFESGSTPVSRASTLNVTAEIQDSLPMSDVSPIAMDSEPCVKDPQPSNSTESNENVDISQSSIDGMSTDRLSVQISAANHNVYDSDIRNVSGTAVKNSGSDSSARSDYSMSKTNFDTATYLTSHGSNRRQKTSYASTISCTDAQGQLAAQSLLCSKLDSHENPVKTKNASGNAMGLSRIRHVPVIPLNKASPLPNMHSAKLYQPYKYASLHGVRPMVSNKDISPQIWPGSLNTQARTFFPQPLNHHAISGLINQPSLSTMPDRFQSVAMPLVRSVTDQKSPPAPHLSGPPTSSWSGKLLPDSAQVYKQRPMGNSGEPYPGRPDQLPGNALVMALNEVDDKALDQALHSVGELASGSWQGVFCDQRDFQFPQ